VIGDVDGFGACALWRRLCRSLPWLVDDAGRDDGCPCVWYGRLFSFVTTRGVDDR
jgi:hypothetical protein